MKKVVRLARSKIHRSLAQMEKAQKSGELKN